MGANGWNFGLGFMLGYVGGLAGLMFFGVLYNRWVAGLELQGHDRGYMAFVVAIGSFVTLSVGGVILGALAGPLVGVAAWGVMLCCFVASGTPMIVGSVLRHVRARADGERAWAGLPEWLARLRSGGADDQGASGQDELEAGAESGRES